MRKFLAAELATFLYAAFTCIVILCTWNSLPAPIDLLLLRLQYISGIIILWLISQVYQKRIMLLVRVIYLLITLSLWYPDTFAINSQFPSLDHIFATWEQNIFGMQPALLFSQTFPSTIVSELMCFGYFSYYLFFVVTIIYIFFCHKEQFEKVAFMIFASFYLCYMIYIFLPVGGPQYYYHAIGMDNVTQGIFPSIGQYYKEHQDCLPIPGNCNGLFYKLVSFAHSSGERPTAAFPSSHVAIATLVMAISIKLRLKTWSGILAIPYILLCLSTVYIYAHYAIDAIAGFILGIVLFQIFNKQHKWIFK